MKMHTYQAISSAVEAHSYRADCIKHISKDFQSVPQNTLLSIYSQLYQHHTKQIYPGHRRPESMTEHYQEYLSASERDKSSELLLHMANKISLSPSLYARVILEQFAVCKELAPPNSTISALISQWIKHPTTIPDTTLQQQVRTCVLNDANYGPLAENVKHSAGHEYEFLLKDKVRELDIPFLDEEVLRGRGYDKTPDVKLEVPVAVQGLAVNWIESKASFGDDYSHKKYLDEQFWSYQNRFGPGLVIYWFGFIEELDIHREQGIMLTDHFPSRDDITMLQSDAV